MRRASPLSTSSSPNITGRATTPWANTSASTASRVRVVEIVGVAQTIKYRQTFEKPTDFVYLPLAQHPDAADGPADAVRPAIRCNWSTR